MQKLQQAGGGTAHCDHIPLVEVVTQLEEAIDRIGKVVLAHLAHELGQVVGDQAVVVGENSARILGTSQPGI